MAGLAEVGRVLVPGGVLGAVWSGPDLEGPFMVSARALLEQGDSHSHASPAQAIFDQSTPDGELVLPPGAPFSDPEVLVSTWDVALNADELLGLLGTFSWVILMSDEQRASLFEVARTALREGLGVEGDVTVDIAYRSEAYRATLLTEGHR